MKGKGINNLTVADGEGLFLDGTRLMNVTRYELCHIGGDAARLAVELEAILSQDAGRDRAAAYMRAASALADRAARKDEGR